MSNIVNIKAEEGANIVGDDSAPALTLKNTGGGTALKIEGSTVANASITGLELSASSVPSGACISLTNTAFVSVISIIFANDANWAKWGAVRVVKTDGTKGWIPIFPDTIMKMAKEP